MTAAIAFTLTNHLAAMVLLGGGGLGSGYQFTSAQLLGVYGGAQLCTARLLFMKQE